MCSSTRTYSCSRSIYWGIKYLLNKKQFTISFILYLLSFTILDLQSQLNFFIFLFYILNFCVLVFYFILLNQIPLIQIKTIYNGSKYVRTTTGSGTGEVLWSTKAAEKGQQHAQANLGMFYENGRGCEIDLF